MQWMEGILYGDGGARYCEATMADTQGSGVSLSVGGLENVEFGQRDDALEMAVPIGNGHGLGGPAGAKAATARTQDSPGGARNDRRRR